MAEANLIYLASPYSDPDPEVRHCRFVSVCFFAAQLFRAGHFVYSPIAHTHPIALNLCQTTELSWEFWAGYDSRMMDACNSLLVLCLDGWENSKGVRAEIAYMEEKGCPIEYRELDDHADLRGLFA